MQRHWLLRTCAAGMIAACVASAASQSNTALPADAGWEEVSEPAFQLNISPRLLKQAIDLLVEKRLMKDYGLDEFQAEELKQLLRREIPTFLQEHQYELEALATQWLEAISGAEPPSAEFAAQWAARFQPIVEEAEGMIGRVGEEMRGFLNDDQQVLLDSYLVASNVATTRIKGTLYEFEQGRFDPDKHWPGNRQVRRRAPRDIQLLESQMTRAREQALDLAYNGEPSPPILKEIPVRAERPATPRDTAAGDRATSGDVQHASRRDVAPRQSGESSPPAVAAPTGAAGASAASSRSGAKAAASKHPWEIYVEEFVRKYSLNEEQAQKARLFLGQAMEQRQKFLASNGPRMEKITELFENAKSEQQRQTAERAYQELITPLDRMFDRLKGKLETLPTRQQRAAALNSAEKTPVRE